ncbi:hypothetical protein Bca4012_025958 [Brassica carinata]
MVISLCGRQDVFLPCVSRLKDVLVTNAMISETKYEETYQDDPEKLKKKVSEEEARLERCGKTMNTIFLNVGDQVLRKIGRCTTTAAKTWSLLEALYMPKSL